MIAFFPCCPCKAAEPQARPRGSSHARGASTHMRAHTCAEGFSREGHCAALSPAPRAALTSGVELGGLLGSLGGGRLLLGVGGELAAVLLLDGPQAAAGQTGPGPARSGGPGRIPPRCSPALPGCGLGGSLPGEDVWAAEQSADCRCSRRRLHSSWAGPPSAPSTTICAAHSAVTHGRRVHSSAQRHIGMAAAKGPSPPECELLTG